MSERRKSNGARAEQMARAVALWEEGRTTSEIASALGGVRRERVLTWLRAAGVYDAAEASRRGWKRSARETATKRRETDESIAALHAEGQTPKEIAGALGITPEYVYMRLKAQGLSLHRLPPGRPRPALREPTGIELAALRTLAEDNSPAARRARILLYLIDNPGDSLDSVAAAQNLSGGQVVRKWIDRFNARGIDALRAAKISKPKPARKFWISVSVTADQRAALQAAATAAGQTVSEYVRSRCTL